MRWLANSGVRSAWTILALLAAQACSNDPPPPPPLDIVEGQLTSAQECRSCHADIYTFWRSSVHATAATNPTFRKAYAEAVETAGDDAGRLCLQCHAPSVVVNQDYEMSQPVTAEGVTCDFCHSMTGLDLAHPDHPFQLDVGPVKLGPIRDAHSTGHAVAYSEFHDSSALCAGCHEYTSRNGVPILTTYSEWEVYQTTSGARTCQQCHMPLVLANIVDPKVKRVQGGLVNTHSTPGGHSKSQLARSLRVRILKLGHTRDGLAVSIEVKNSGAGHGVPTGSPTRKVILTVEALPEGGSPLTQSRVYQRRLVDAAGLEITRDSRIFTEAAGVGEDTRLAAGETRIEDFQFNLAPGPNVEVTATLTYLYSPHELEETETRIVFFNERRKLTTSWQR